MHVYTLHFLVLHSIVHAMQPAHALSMILDFLNYISIDVTHLGARLLSVLCVLTSYTNSACYSVGLISIHVAAEWL